MIGSGRARTGAVTMLFWLALWPGLAAALSSDSDQPIHIIADQAVRDERTGETIYRGNVRINQGTLQIDADQVTIYRVEVEADKIVAVGTPAQMQQQRDEDGEMVYAEGEVIEYYKEKEHLLLLKNAQLEQDGSTVRGDRIDYFITDELVKAASDGTDSGKRVEVVIPAHKVDEQD